MQRPLLICLTAIMHKIFGQVKQTSRLITVIDKCVNQMTFIFHFSMSVIVQPYMVYAQDSLVMSGNTAVIKSVISEHARDYVRVVSWDDDSDSRLTLGGRYFLMPSGDLVITNVNDADTKSLFYCTTENILTGERRVSNPAKVFLRGT